MKLRSLCHVTFYWGLVANYSILVLPSRAVNHGWVEFALGRSQREGDVADGRATACHINPAHYYSIRKSNTMIPEFCFTAIHFSCVYNEMFVH